MIIKLRQVVTTHPITYSYSSYNVYRHKRKGISNLFYSIIATLIYGSSLWSNGFSTVPKNYQSGYKCLFSQYASLAAYSVLFAIGSHFNNTSARCSESQAS